MHKVNDPTTMHNLHAYYLHSQKIMEEKCKSKTSAELVGVVGAVAGAEKKKVEQESVKLPSWNKKVVSVI